MLTQSRQPGFFQELPPAIRQLQQLHSAYPSQAFAECFLATYSQPKELSMENFVAGISQFTEIANLTIAQREAYFGNQFYGLHYATSLADFWNTTSPEKIKAHKLYTICPLGWDYRIEDNHFILVYRGDDLSTALDKLLQGPTVIDCGMFCQLAIWFGIRYMLGNDTFNMLFGRAPFYVTQFNYQPIITSTMPHLGNPLYQFFHDCGSSLISSDVSISYVPNHPSYAYKHPGGLSLDLGQNCVVIGGNRYIVFDPHWEKASALNKQDVEQLLLGSLNAPQDDSDTAKLELYAQRPEEIHPKFNKTFQELIEMAGQLAGFTATSIDPKAKEEALSVQFDFAGFCSWVTKMLNVDFSSAVNYKPLTGEEVNVGELMMQFPYENRASMSFSTFRTDTPLQRKMFLLAKKFCQDVMQGKSSRVILTGRAGIGKTASAVICAKELSSRGKKIIWISEVMMRRWTAKTESMEGLEASREEIKRLLSTNPDAVFLDDDNLVDYDGRVLLEEIYAWYVNCPGKGLFVTSNEPLTFENCYGLKIDAKYHFPPFLEYTSSQYTNTIMCCDLDGPSMRLQPTLSVMEFSECEKIAALARCNFGQSVGIIVTPEIYETEKGKLLEVEFIPAVAEEILRSISISLWQQGIWGPEYERLTGKQKEWLKIFEVSRQYEYRDSGSYTMPQHKSICVKPFESTNCDIVAVELLQRTNWNGKEIVQEDSLNQLLRVINYAHDSGGKKVIIVNHTKFTHEELLVAIKAGISEREKERTSARIDAMFFSGALVTEMTKQDGPEGASEKQVSKLAKNVVIEAKTPTMSLVDLLRAVENYVTKDLPSRSCSMQ